MIKAHATDVLTDCVCISYPRLGTTYSAHNGTNADLMPHIFGLYIPEGSVVADVSKIVIG